MSWICEINYSFTNFLTIIPIATHNEIIDIIKNSFGMPYFIAIGSSNIGDANCPKKKLEVNNPDALPLLLSETKDKNQAFILAVINPNPIGLGLNF